MLTPDQKVSLIRILEENIRFQKAATRIDYEKEVQNAEESLRRAKEHQKDYDKWIEEKRSLIEALKQP